ncbi:IPT/TIG domain-containing protein [Actinoplanes sp. L3-i22]|uniref:IPT/TIG domain-containing protein n=1 Tax=Actinoplanes sp. L3-i22 TaxID=2836373 RepID=UPI001C748B2F|nr:IPT/TIG domain-containing protein [Actinoplanes sp. L3-i22]BCY13909.1 hypothetical protein L3i22_089970 [Actinoplanes sp. L3-i22]
MSTWQHAVRRAGRAGVAAVASSALILAGGTTPADAAAPDMALTATAGPSGGGNTIIGVVAGSAANPNPFPAGAVPVVQFQYAACTAKASDTVQIDVTGITLTAGVLQADPFSVKRLSSTKIAFVVPTTGYPDSTINGAGLVLAGSQTSAKWNVCVYDSDSTTNSMLLAAATYTVVPEPTITSITPASSPASGGKSITINGTGFIPVGNPITASVGGVALTDVKVSPTGTSITGTTGARVAETGLELTVTTPGGTVGSLDPNGDGDPTDAIPFTYSNGITISPNTGAVGTAVAVDVTGVGFSQLHFDAGSGTPTSGNAHLFLVVGAYNSSNNRGVAECVRVGVVTDTELVCTLDLSGNQLSPVNSALVPSTPIADGAYILTLVTDGSLGVGANPTNINSGSAFVVGPY